MTSGKYTAELQTFSGRTIDVPSCFIAGKSDWGVYQKPGDFEKMQNSVCTRMLGCHLVDGAGHWVQQEQPGDGEELFGGRLLFRPRAARTSQGAYRTDRERDWREPHPGLDRS
jgi:pimeloyl-ACP methyl ester carboxylesterase